MHRPARRHSVRIATTAALAGLLLSGCSTAAGPFARLAGAREPTVEQRQQQAVSLAETAVMAAPLDAVLRARLGTAYLSAGRFQAAATSFREAAALGDTTPATALQHALALTGAGRNAEAATLLFAHADQLPAADLGLALAMAGEVGPAIRTMEAALRFGENSVALRQNLALAYALAGRWREARLLAARDLPADKLGQRMEQWAAMALTGPSPQVLARVLRVQPGPHNDARPEALALAATATTHIVAEEGQATEIGESTGTASRQIAAAAPDVGPSRSLRSYLRRKAGAAGARW